MAVAENCILTIVVLISGRICYMLQYKKVVNTKVYATCYNVDVEKTYQKFNRI